MDTDASAGRLPAFPTANIPTLQTSGDHPGPQNRRHSSGSESGFSSSGSVAEHPQGVQQPQPDFDASSARFGANSEPFHPPRRLSNESATIYASDPPYVPPEVLEAARLAQGGGFNVSQQGSVDSQALSPSASAQTPSPQRSGSGSSSPTDSVASQESRGPARITVISDEGSPMWVSSDTEHSHSASELPASNFVRVQESIVLPAFDRARYPAYDANARRVGMEHVLYPTSTPNITGQSHYRPRTNNYPVGNNDPRVMTFDASTAPPVPAFMRPGPNPVPAPPGGLPIYYNMRGPALPDSRVPVSVISGPTYSQSRMSHSQPLDSHSHVPDIPDIPDPSPHLRQLLGLGPDEEVNLYALPDPPPGERPNYPLPTLIKLAIFGSPRKRLTLQEIYAALQERFEWFRDNVHDKSWQNSIRHNLSLNLCFRKVFKPATEPGKGYYWMVDYSNGEGNKRPRKRNKRPTKAERERRAREKETAARANSSSSYEDDQGEDTQSESQTQPQTPASDVSKAASPEGDAEEANIDPELRNQGHAVGEGHARTSTGPTARRSARRAESPYQSPMSVTQGSSQGRRTTSPVAAAPAVQTSPAASLTAQEHIARQAGAYAQTAFSQTAFNQSSLSNNWQATFGMAQAGMPQQPVWGLVPPQSEISASQPAPLMPTSAGQEAPSVVDSSIVRMTRSMTATAIHPMGDRDAPVEASPTAEHISNPSGVAGATHMGSRAPTGTAQRDTGMAQVHGGIFGQGNRRNSSSSNSSRE